MVYTDKYVEVTGGSFIKSRHTVEAQMKMRDYNGKTFIATLYNVLFATDFCYRLSFIIASMLLGYTCFFHKGFFIVSFIDHKQNAVTLLQSVKKNSCIFSKNKVNSKNTKASSKK